MTALAAVLDFMNAASTAQGPDGVAPGGVLVVADKDRIILRQAFGARSTRPHVGAPVTLDTRYDVASLTKVLATTTILAHLVHRGAVDLAAPAARWLPELPSGEITVRHLLAHEAGLPWWRPLHEGLGAAPGEPRAALVARAATEPLEAAPGARARYSDLGFILLGALAERAGGARLDVLFRDLVAEPLGLGGTGFVDLRATPPARRPDPVAPTENTEARGLVTGEVHDENAHAAGGICGHAGLFSTGDDVLRVALAWAAAARSEEVAGGVPPGVARTFLTRSPLPGSSWRLGWDSPSEGPGSSQAGDLWPRSGFGHNAFTGCSVWIDAPTGRAVVLLTNRVHPSRGNERIRSFRPRLHDLVWTALESG